MPLIESIVEDGRGLARDRLTQMGADRTVKAALTASVHVEQRYQDLLDLVDE